MLIDKNEFKLAQMIKSLIKTISKRKNVNRYIG